MTYASKLSVGSQCTKLQQSNKRLIQTRRPVMKQINSRTFTDDPVSAIGYFLWPQRDYRTLSRSPCEQFHLT